MSILLRLQNQFQDYLLNHDPNFENQIVNTPHFPAKKRLAIYKNAYQLRLIDGLASHYPVLQTYLGTKQFQKCAREYMMSFPSRYRSIRWFGNELPRFLIEHPKYSKRPYLSELAEFEWSLTLTFDAADSMTLQLDDIQKIPADSWANMYFHPIAALQRMDLSWNTVAIWQAMMNGSTIKKPRQNQKIMPWIIWRNRYDNQFHSLSQEEAWAIDAIIDGKNFGNLCEGLCQWIDESQVGLYAASLLKGWIVGGLLSEVVL